MNTTALLNFIEDREHNTVKVERTFNAPIDKVWAAWTDATILDQWWAPKPWKAITHHQDFKESGRWLYYMQSPEGERHWSFFDYTNIRPQSQFAGTDGFCDENGVVNRQMPRTDWENIFVENNGSTTVTSVLKFSDAQAMETLLEMGFKEGFTMGLQNLDDLIANGQLK